MDKQETAFTIWANSVLQPDEEQVVLADDLASKRLAARVRALLWRLYSEDEGVISVMLRLEKRINEGLLRTRNEVSCPNGLTAHSSSTGCASISTLSLILPLFPYNFTGVSIGGSNFAGDTFFGRLFWTRCLQNAVRQMCGGWSRWLYEMKDNGRYSGKHDASLHL